MENLRLLTQEFNNMINGSQIGLYDRPRATALLAANVVGRDLILPSARVDHPQAYYRNTIKSVVLDKLNTINEAVPLDLDVAEDMIYRVWYMRYVLVHEPSHPLGQKVLALSMTCNESTVSKDTVDFLKSYPKLFEGSEFVCEAE